MFLYITRKYFLYNLSIHSPEFIRIICAEYVKRQFVCFLNSGYGDVRTPSADFSDLKDSGVDLATSGCAQYPSKRRSDCRTAFSRLYPHGFTSQSCAGTRLVTVRRREEFSGRFAVEAFNVPAHACVCEYSLRLSRRKEASTAPICSLCSSALRPRHMLPVTVVAAVAILRDGSCGTGRQCCDQLYRCNMPFKMLE